MLADVNNASIDAIPKSGGTKQASLLSIAAENSGRSSLSRSEARPATAISTFSILALSANLRERAHVSNGLDFRPLPFRFRNCQTCDEGPALSPQISNERAALQPATPVPMHYPAHARYWGHYR
ncbi:MAG TPA: hypothetical protein VKP52_03380 [Pseudolabrys sp.]|nr:hypothetical protein [Pseudolabrys sp.]